MHNLYSLHYETDKAYPYNVSLVTTSIYIVWAALLQSSGIVTKRKPAIIVLAHKQSSVLEEHNSELVVIVVGAGAVLRA
jgi:hypothetical protein